MSIRAKYIDKAPNVELRYAYKAEDLLAVMWVRFYEQMVDRGPTDYCLYCGDPFEKNSKAIKKYCSAACGRNYRTEKSRNNKKAASKPLVEDGN